MKRAYKTFLKRRYRIFRHHVITGFIFLMPVMISIIVIGKFWDKLLAMGGAVAGFLRIDTVFGPAGDAIMALFLLLLFCVVAGFLVKMTMFKRMSDWLDEKLSAFIPGYTDLRKETEVKIGATKAEEVFETCLVHIEDHWKPAYLIDIDDDGRATVFIPVAPTFTTGQVVVTSSGNCKKLEIDSKALNAYLEKMGKGLAVSIQGYPNLTV